MRGNTVDDENESGVEADTTGSVESGTVTTESNLTAQLEAANAAVAQRDATIAAREADLAARDAEIQEWKARNFDLMNAAGGEPVTTAQVEADDANPLSDLFG